MYESSIFAVATEEVGLAFTLKKPFPSKYLRDW